MLHMYLALESWELASKGSERNSTIEATGNFGIGTLLR